jgi:hypothetical protein
VAAADLHPFSGDAPLVTIGPDGIPTSKTGQPYPNVIDPGRGQRVPFPIGELKVIPEDQRTPYDGSHDRAKFIKEWLDRGYPSPPQGWGGEFVHLHHIQPLSRGGTNAFENLVPLAPAVHELFTRYWSNY